MVKIPSLLAVEAELLRRGLDLPDREEKAVPTEGDAELPEVVQAADRLTGTDRRLFLEGIAAIKASFPLDEIRQAMSAGHGLALFQQFIDGAIPLQFASPTRELFRVSYLAGAKVGVRQLAPEGISWRQGGTIRFDQVNAHAVEWARHHAGARITEITEDQVRMAAQLIAGSLQEGWPVEEVARDLRLFIGLHSRQVSTLSRYRAELSDRGEQAERIAHLIEKRARGMLNLRARMIARTEILNGANAGQRGLWRQAAADGLIDRSRTSKVWITTQDDLAEEYCLELDGVAVGLDENFASELGPLDGPTAHPGCRCGLNIIFTRS